MEHLDFIDSFLLWSTGNLRSYVSGSTNDLYFSQNSAGYNNVTRLRWLEGNLDRLFQEDINKFIEYNIRDVEILIELEKRFKFIELTIAICHLCHVPYEPDFEECMTLNNAYIADTDVDIAHMILQGFVDHIEESALAKYKDGE